MPGQKLATLRIVLITDMTYMAPLKLQVAAVSTDTKYKNDSKAASSKLS
jgi:hypothetical protein